MLPKTGRLPRLFAFGVVVSMALVLFIYPLTSDRVKVNFLPHWSAVGPPPPLPATKPGSRTNVTTPTNATKTGSPQPGAATAPTKVPAKVTSANTKSPPTNVKNASAKSPPTVTNTNGASSQSHHEPRVMCWIPSVEKWIKDRIQAVNDTWVPRCDGHVFFINTAKKDDRYGDLVPLEVKDGREHLTAKSVAALKYLYQHDLDKFDWFLKGDDDAFVVVENLRLLLRQYNASRPVYLGRLFKKYLKHGYMSGGASYVLSREALRKVNVDGFDKNACKAQRTDEDVEIGRCLEKVGVYPHNSLDTQGRSAFHAEGPQRHMGTDAPPSAADLEYDRFPAWTGRNCCSELSISFHHMKPEEIRMVNHLLYRTTVYGRVPDFDKLRGFFKAKEVPPL